MSTDTTTDLPRPMIADAGPVSTIWTDGSNSGEIGVMENYDAALDHYIRIGADRIVGPVPNDGGLDVRIAVFDRDTGERRGFLDINLADLPRPKSIERWTDDEDVEGYIGRGGYIIERYGSERDAKIADWYVKHRGERVDGIPAGRAPERDYRPTHYMGPDPSEYAVIRPLSAYPADTFPRG